MTLGPHYLEDMKKDLLRTTRKLLGRIAKGLTDVWGGGICEGCTELIRAFVLESVWTKAALHGQYLHNSLDICSDSAT